MGLRLQQPTGLWTNAFGYITNTYDGNARLLSTTLKNSSHTTLNAHEYGYNVGNQRTQQVFSVGSTYNYTYDAIGQLKVADSATASEDRGYLYDAAWNLNRRTNNAYVEQFDVDSKNQLDFPGYYTYDGNGNLTWFDVFEYTYDDENRLIKAASPGGDWWTDYVYDGLGRLRQRVVWTYEYVDDDFYWVPVETRYVYDGFRVIQDRNAQGNPTISYTRGTDLSGSLEGAGGIGGLLALSGGTTHLCYHADGNGNVTYMANSSQAMVARYRYDPFGNTISSAGSLV